jgi:DNA-binding transcriptional LysR family regulator
LAALDELKSHPSGLLRLTVSSIAEHFLGDTTLSGFLEAYPDIALDVFVDDDDADIVAQGFDAGVRLGEVIDSDMVAVSVSGPQRQIVVCAPQGRGAHGAPQHPRELNAHACIGWRHFSHPAPYRWEFAEDGRQFEVAVDARLNTNDMRLMVLAACRYVLVSTRPRRVSQYAWKGAAPSASARGQPQRRRAGFGRCDVVVGCLLIPSSQQRTPFFRDDCPLVTAETFRRTESREQLRLQHRFIGSGIGAGCIAVPDSCDHAG